MCLRLSHENKRVKWMRIRLCSRKTNIWNNNNRRQKNCGTVICMPKVFFSCFCLNTRTHTFHCFTYVSLVLRTTKLILWRWNELCYQRHEWEKKMIKIELWTFEPRSVDDIYRQNRKRRRTIIKFHMFCAIDFLIICSSECLFMKWISFPLKFIEFWISFEYSIRCSWFNLFLFRV